MTLQAPEPTAQSTKPDVRLAEVIASFALATDLATGQPLEHGLRRTVLAVWLDRIAEPYIGSRSVKYPIVGG